jgi:hypothetical protein
MSPTAVHAGSCTAITSTFNSLKARVSGPDLHLLRVPARSRYTTSATIASAAKPAKKKKPALTLEHFLLRQRVLGLYRSIIRGLQALPPGDAQRSDLRAYARGEFERHREVTDAGKIRYLVSTGKTEFDGMKRYLAEMGGR